MLLPYKIGLYFLCFGLSTMIIKKIRKFIFHLQQKILFSMVKTSRIGADVSEMNLDPSKPIVYAVLYPSLAERLVVDREVQNLGWPSPFQQHLEGKIPTRPFFSIYRRSRALFQRQPTPVVSRDLITQAQWLGEDESREIQIVPVRVFWGRSPDKEGSFFRIWLQLSGTFGGRLSRLMAILLNGRNTFVHFSRPISLRDLYEQSQTSEKLARKVARILRVHNRQVSASVLGPDLSHRRTLVHQLPNRPMVLKAIEEEAKTKKISKEKARKRALKYADEIASNISYSNVRFLDVLLTWVWNKLYAGVSVHNLSALHDHSKDNEVVYVPCHRSHIDYLLLSYVLYHNGFQIPHIAAGINLNMPIVGSILRRGGAFFMRRTFRDNQLYAAVFDEYLHSVFTGGYATEYFVEGGRSRTGRTLNPKAGMVAMTLRSYLRDSSKPIVFMPVYTGYEKVFEANSYLGELRGAEKKKESIFGVLGTLRAFKKSFGKVSVTIGEPIYLSDFLDKHQPGWREEDYAACDYRPDWAVATVDKLTNKVVTGINSATSVNPINLIALGLLSTPRQAMGEQMLALLIEEYRALLAALPYSNLTVLPEGNGLEWLAHAEALDAIRRTTHELGDLIQTSEKQAVILTYYRNNVLHLLALPSLIACLFINNQRYDAERVIHIVKQLYPYIRAELFLHWSIDELDEVVQQWLDLLVEKGYLVLNEKGYHSVPASSTKHAFLESLAANLLQTLERYFLTLSVLQNNNAQALTAKSLEEQSTLLAQRISMLYGINAPEFFDKSLFRTLIQQLLKQGLIEQVGENLTYNDHLDDLAATLEELLAGGLKQSILRSLTLN